MPIGLDRLVSLSGLPEGGEGLMRRTWVVLAGVLTGIGGLAGCGGGSAAGGGTSGSDASSASVGKVMVGAGAALPDAFTTIGEHFQAATPGADVVFTFDSSVSLANQVLSDAPVEVYAAPKDENLQRLVSAGRVSTPTPFATNSMVIIAKAGNPTGIKTLNDLAGADMVALGSSSIPCGNLAGQILQHAGVTIPESHVTRGQTVKAVVTAVTRGDAVAGIVFLSDAKTAAGHVATVAIPVADNATAVIVIAAVLARRGAQPSAGASAFISWVLGSDGQQVLAQAGFGPKP